MSGPGTEGNGTFRGPFSLLPYSPTTLPRPPLSAGRIPVHLHSRLSPRTASVVMFFFRPMCVCHLRVRLNFGHRLTVICTDVRPAALPPGWSTGRRRDNPSSRSHSPSRELRYCYANHVLYNHEFDSGPGWVRHRPWPTTIIMRARSRLLVKPPMHDGDVPWNERKAAREMASDIVSR